MISNFSVVNLSEKIKRGKLSSSELEALYEENNFMLSPTPMIWCPPGSFIMGSDEEYALASEKPAHEVTFKNCFFMSKYTITNTVYNAVMKKKGGAKDNLPVVNVSWFDAVEFCKQLTKQEQEAGRLPENWEYSLPSEAEWEYACRAGTTGKWFFGDDENLLKEYAWYYDNSGGRVHAVGELKPNPWGFHDILGNVWEWCLDTWHENYNGAPTDGSAWIDE